MHSSSQTAHTISTRAAHGEPGCQQRQERQDLHPQAEGDEVFFAAEAIHGHFEEARHKRDMRLGAVEPPEQQSGKYHRNGGELGDWGESKQHSVGHKQHALQDGECMSDLVFESVSQLWSSTSL